jgi:hypothetical protein
VRSTSQVILDKLHSHSEESSITDESEGLTNSEIDETSSSGDMKLSEQIYRYSVINSEINSDFNDARLAIGIGGRHVSV